MTTASNREIGGARIFNRFDVVSDVSDHHFVKSNGSNLTKKKGKGGEGSEGGDAPFANLPSSLHKRIMKEWKILENHLPESIYVRVYENRIDLLRAAIIGAAGTPYHDGLFLFDIAFPSDYPLRPPMVYYHSFGLRLNPNLYIDGKVCLSLLGTWPGRTKSEKWNPKQSTILQVLISIQALILNEKPYFNEPINDTWLGRRNGEKKSVAYNEDKFFLSCKSMVFLLRKKPKNFSEIITAHFRERARVVLSACRSYMNDDVTVGYYGNDESFSPRSAVKSSEHFKKVMMELYPLLVSAFTKTGANLGILAKLKTTSDKEVSKKKKKKNRTVSNFFRKIKTVLGLEKGV